MTYKEFVNCYPWIDLALELFKGIVPTIVALLAIFLNNFFSRKREMMYRKKSLQLDYFVKVLNWLHEIKNNIMEVSLDLENALNKMNPDERKNRYNDFMKSISDMNSCIVSWNDTYNVVLNCYNCDIKFRQFMTVVNNCSKEFINIGNKYINQADTTKATVEINNVVIKTNEAIDESIMLLLNEINTLY